MAGSIPGGAFNAIGTALIPETMARFQMPQLIEQAKREQQVGNIQAGRLLSGANAELGTPQTKSFQVNGRTVGQDNPSTIQPLFSQAKKMALFSQAMPEQARAFQAQQIQNSIAPRPLTKDDFIGEPGKGGVLNIRSGEIVPGTQITEEQAPYSDVGKLFADFRANRITAPVFQQELNRITNPNAAEAWKPITKDEAVSLGLNPTGSYQRNSKGQIQVITQPKQDAPTETQSKYAYNAKRVADGLAAVNGILEKDKGASSSWWLNATTDSLASNIPGVPELGRSTASDNSQIVRNNMADVVDAVITLGTGAAYTQEQLKAARNSFLPQPGESSKVKQDKFRKLASIYDQARVNARSAGQELPDISAFSALFGAPDDGGDEMPVTPQNDPLGIRGR